MIVGALEGAMLVARPYDDLSRFQVIADGVIGGLANGTVASSTSTLRVATRTSQAPSPRIALTSHRVGGLNP